jgi:serine/threonine protein kinase
VAKIIFKVAEAIKYMNDEMGGIHRDLKPENVLVGPDGIDNLKVTDFGLARLGVDGDDGFVGTFQAGTEGYMAPELVDRRNCVEGKVSYGSEPFKVDVFSLGVLMFICCTKTPPFGLGPAATNLVLQGKYDRTAMASIHPPAARELCKNMLMVNQSDRYSIEQVLADPWLRQTAGQ